MPPLPGTSLGQGRQEAPALEQPTMDWNLRSRSHFANLPVLLGTISGQGGSVVRSHRGRAQGSPRGSWRPGSPRGAGDTRRRKRKSKGWVCGVRLCNLAAPRGRGGRVPAGCRAEDPCVGPGATPCPALLDPKAEPRQLGFQRRSSAAPRRRGRELHPEPELSPRPPSALRGPRCPLRPPASGGHGRLRQEGAWTWRPARRRVLDTLGFAA